MRDAIVNCSGRETWLIEPGESSYGDVEAARQWHELRPLPGEGRSGAEDDRGSAYGDRGPASGRGRGRPPGRRREHPAARRGGPAPGVRGEARLLVRPAPLVPRL